MSNLYFTIYVESNNDQFQANPNEYMIDEIDDLDYSEEFV